MDDSNDTLIASGTNKRVVLPASYQNYQGNWKLKLLTSGDLTIYNIPKSSSVDIFLVGGGAKGGTGDWIYPWSGGTCYRGGTGGMSGWAGKPNGCSSSPATAGEAGKPNTGGGAGCKKEELSGGAGGTGIVILRNKR